MNLTSSKKINLKQRLILNTVIFVCGFALILYFAILMTATKMKDLRAEIIAEKIKIEKKIDQEQNKGELASKIKEIESDLDKFNGLFITKNQELDFITALEDIANQNNVEQEINLLPKKSDETSATIKKNQINIAVNGTYSNVLQYLADLESMSYYVNIDTVNINSQQKNTPEGPINTISLILSAYTYWK